MNREDKDLLNQFSAYVKVAIKHKRQEYMNKKSKIRQHELPLFEDMEMECVEDTDILKQIEDMSDELEQKNHEICLLLNQIENYALFQVVNSLTRQQKEILLLKIFYMKSFNEIGTLLGIPQKKAEATYYNSIRKIRKILGGKHGF